MAEFGGFLCQLEIQSLQLTSSEAACVHEQVANADCECPLYNNFISLSMNCEIETMQGNEILIESLLRNLITNAHHAILQKRDMQVLEVTRNSEKKNMVVLNNEISNKEEGIIEVQIFSIEQGIKIVVSDNGCGMKEEDRKQIFEPFYRVNKARSRENGGSGLGLAFCKKIVELHHGKIEVESKVGIGTKFSILL